MRGTFNSELLQRIKSNDKTLTRVNLGRNYIGDKGAKALADALAKNQTLIELILSSNGIGNNFLDLIKQKLASNKAKALIQAAEQGALEAVKALVNKGVALNYQDEEGNTALHHAAQKHHKAVVDYLLTQPHQPILRNNKGELPKDIPAVQPIKSQPQIVKPVVQPVKSEPGKPAVTLAISYTIPYADLTFSVDKHSQPVKLGEGGFGAVYKGTWQYVEVAIKKLHISIMTEKALQEFKQETEMMSKLAHPHIIRLYGACTEPEKYCMVMEYMPKGSLYHVLHSLNPPDWPVRWKIALDIGKGILHLHSKNILHRDLKSLNVLIDNDYNAKVSDFGLSLVKTETATSTHIAINHEVGTTRWMAPELFQGEKCTPKADIYSYGIILWEIAAGKIPYDHIHDNNIVRKYVKKGNRETIPANTPPSYAKLIAKCWAQRADERPTIKEVVEELNEKQNEATMKFVA